jgi:hypothetical protein
LIHHGLGIALIHHGLGIACPLKWLVALFSMATTMSTTRIVQAGGAAPDSCSGQVVRRCDEKTVTGKRVSAGGLVRLDFDSSLR